MSTAITSVSACGWVHRMAGNSGDPGRTVASKVAVILAAFTAGAEHTLSQIAHQTSLPVSTVHRLLSRPGGRGAARLPPARGRAAGDRAGAVQLHPAHGDPCRSVAVRAAAGSDARVRHQRRRARRGLCGRRAGVRRSWGIDRRGRGAGRRPCRPDARASPAFAAAGGPRLEPGTRCGAMAPTVRSADPVLRSCTGWRRAGRTGSHAPAGPARPGNQVAHHDRRSGVGVLRVIASPPTRCGSTTVKFGYGNLCRVDDHPHTAGSAPAVRRDPAHTSICRGRAIMGKRRLNGSRFDLLPLGELADLAAVAAHKALVDTLSGRAPGTVPPVSDPVAELLVELLAAWAADARRDPPVWEVLSAPEIRGVPSVRSPSTPRRPLRQTCLVAPDNRAWLMRCGSPPISAPGCAVRTACLRRGHMRSTRSSPS